MYILASRFVAEICYKFSISLFFTSLYQISHLNKYNDRFKAQAMVKIIKFCYNESFIWPNPDFKDQCRL